MTHLTNSRFPFWGLEKAYPTFFRAGDVEVAHEVVSISRSETRDGCR